MVPVFSQQALEANAAEVILAEGLYLLSLMNLASGLVDLSNLSVVVLHYY